MYACMRESVLDHQLIGGLSLFLKETMVSFLYSLQLFVFNRSKHQSVKCLILTFAELQIADILATYGGQLSETERNDDYYFEKKLLRFFQLGTNCHSCRCC